MTDSDGQQEQDTRQANGEPRPRRPLDGRSLSEQYQFTQGDTIVSRERAKDAHRGKQRKRRQWLFSWIIVISFFVLVIFLIN